MIAHDSMRDNAKFRELDRKYRGWHILNDVLWRIRRCRICEGDGGCPAHKKCCPVLYFSKLVRETGAKKTNVTQNAKNLREGGNRKYDLTEGNILQKLMMVAMPIIGTQLILMSYNLTDVFLLGRVGSDAVAASGTAGMFMWLSNGMMLIGRMGAEIGVAQNMGRGDLAAARKFSQNAVMMALTLGCLYACVCFFFAAWLVGFFGIKEVHVAHDAANYLRIVAVGMPGMFFAAAVIGTFNGSGNSRVPFLINSAGLVLNAILDPIFIFGLGLGVSGAAIATVIAQSVGCSLFWLALKRKNDRPFIHILLISFPVRRYVAQILRWSVPIGVESMLFTFFSMLIARAVAGFGAHGIAVFRVGSQIESLCWLTCMGFSTAITAFVGQNFGAGKWDRIRACTRISLVAVCAWGVFVTLLLAFAGRLLFSFFLPDERLIGMGAEFLRILAFCQVLSCLEAMASGTFRGLGKTLPPSVVSISCNGLRVPLAYTLSRTGLGLNGIWVGMTVGAAMRGGILFLWYLYAFERKNKEKPFAEDFERKQA